MKKNSSNNDTHLLKNINTNNYTTIHTYYHVYVKKGTHNNDTHLIKNINTNNYTTMHTFYHVYVKKGTQTTKQKK